MKLHTCSAVLVLHLLIGLAPTVAQQCARTIPVNDNADNVFYGSGVALFSFLNRLPSGRGEVEVYEKSPASGVFEFRQTLTANHSLPGYGSFGFSAATDGQTIVVIDDDVFLPNVVSVASVFERNSQSNTWELTAQFSPPASAVSKKFYGGLAVRGDRIYLGSPIGPGIVYVLARDPISRVWSYVQPIAPPVGTANQWFGAEIALDGNTLAIGALTTNSYRGTVEMYEFSTALGRWIHSVSLAPNGLTAWAEFGAQIDLDGDQMIVGTPLYDVGLTPNVGAAFIWLRSASGSWALSHSIINSAGEVDDAAGARVAIEGGQAYISVLRDRNPAGLRRGAIWPYLFNPATNTWNSAPRYFTDTPAGYSPWSPIGSKGMGVEDGELVFSGTKGTSPALHITGVSGQDCDGNGVDDLCDIMSGSGSDLNGNGLLDVCEDIGLQYCTATAPNSAGLLGELVVDGSVFAPNNNLTLRAKQLPYNQFGYAINSPYQGVIPNVAGSQGNLCIFGPSLGRHNRSGEVRFSGSSGEFDIIVDLTSFPSPGGAIMVQAGETWNFQVWHRDQNPTNTSNLTNAVSITFQ